MLKSMYSNRVMFMAIYNTTVTVIVAEVLQILFPNLWNHFWFYKLKFSLF